MNKQTPATISLWHGEFHDRELEHGYFADEIRSMGSYIRPITLLFGILYLVFAIPDYFVMTDRRIFLYILLSRILFLAICAFLSIMLPKTERQTKFYLLISVSEIVFILIYLLSCFLYQPLNLMIQAIGIIVILCGLYLIPNRLTNLILLSFLLIGLFLAGAVFLSEQPDRMELTAISTYLATIVFINSLAFLRLNYYRRKQFAISIQLHHLSCTDPLTGIFNRQKFNEAFENEVNRSHRYRSCFSLILFDIDHFKLINDAHGHPQGDRVLIQIVELVEQHLRATDVFARWGGEEFILLLPETRLTEAKEIAERLRHLIASLDKTAAYHVTCSFGVAESRPKDTMESLMKRVDDLMYDAKQNGRNQIAVD